MASCFHSSLLQLTKSDTFAFCNPNRLEKVSQNLEDPANQRPSILFFVGAAEKQNALSHMFKLDRLRKGAREGNSLRVDQKTLNSEHPLYIAESDIKPPKLKSFQLSTCHEGTTWRTNWRPSGDINVWMIVHARLFFLFADVICLFAEDFGGLDGVIEYIQVCARIGSASQAPRQIRPRVVIVCSPQDSSPTLRVLEVEQLRYKLLQEGAVDLHDSFSEISIFELSEHPISPRMKYQFLHQSLLKHTEQMRQLRDNCSYLFNAVHQNAFFDRAVQNLSEDPSQPFNFIEESRKHNPVSKTFPAHMTRFLELSVKLKAPYEAITTLIACAILLNAYPRYMHSK